MNTEAAVAEQASWIVANWEAVSMIVAGVLALFGVTGKAVTLWRALRLVMGQLENPESKDQRVAVRIEAQEFSSPGVAAVIRNMAARVDPKAEKQPKLRDAVKGIAVDFAAGAIAKLFRRGK